MLTMPLHLTTLRDLGSKSPPDADRAVRLADRGGDWRVCESWRDRLFGPGAPNWLALEHEATAELVKMGHLRAVWRVAVGDHTVYAKVLDLRRWTDRVKRLLLGSAAEREWLASCEAQRRDVPVVRGLAVGVLDGRHSRAAFLSEGLAGAVTLPEAWRRDVGTVSWRQRRRAGEPLIDAVAKLFATAHQRGFMHRDAHPSNILLRTDSIGGRMAVFADVHAGAFRRGAVSRRHAIRALAQLDHFFRRLVTQAERLRFLRAYRAYRTSSGHPGFAEDSERDVLAAILSREAIHAAGLARQRDRRLRGNGKYFSMLSLGCGWRARCALALERRHVFPEADVPDRMPGDWRELLQSALGAIADGETAGVHAGPKGIRLAVSRSSGLLKRCWWTVRGPPDLRAFLQCHRLRHRDEPAELLLAYAEHRRTGLIDTTVVIRPDRPGNDHRDKRSNQGSRV